MIITSSLHRYALGWQLMTGIVRSMKLEDILKFKSYKLEQGRQILMEQSKKVLTVRSMTNG